MNILPKAEVDSRETIPNGERKNIDTNYAWMYQTYNRVVVAIQTEEGPGINQYIELLHVYA